MGEIKSYQIIYQLMFTENQWVPRNRLPTYVYSKQMCFLGTGYQIMFTENSWVC